MQKKGISLIVLVITIIVMIILAASVVISLSNTGIINKANQAVQLTDERQVQDLAGLVWAECYLDTAKKADIVNSVKTELANQGVTEDKWNITVTETGVTVTPKTNNEWDKSGYYINIDDNNVITFYDGIPNNVSPGDLYLCGEYFYYFGDDGWDLWLATKDNAELWEIYNIVENYEWTDVNKTNYEPIQESINGVPVKYMQGTFRNCINLIETPLIPSTVVNLGEAFDGCTNLKKITNIPENVKEMHGTFRGCENLTTVPKLPSALESMTETFSGCKLLTDAPVIPDTVTTIRRAFAGCITLTKAPIIPDGVEDISDTFSDCAALTEAPVIPNSVIYMNYTFSNCTSLVGMITINSTPTGYYGCLRNTGITQIIGNCENKSEILATK